MKQSTQYNSLAYPLRPLINLVLAEVLLVSAGRDVWLSIAGVACRINDELALLNSFQFIGRERSSLLKLQTRLTSPARSATRV